MDPLSISASIAGLLAISGTIYSTLARFTSSVNDAPRSVHSVMVAVEGLRLALSSVEGLICTISAVPQRRKALIQLDHLIITLTHSMITFSDLESQVSPLVLDSATNPSVWDRLKFVWQEESILNCIQRLESHKLSITLMLSILQCESDEDAWRSQERLHSMFERQIEQNQDMRSRLTYLENVLGAMARSIKGFEEDQSNTAASRRQSSLAYGFEEMLVLDNVISDGAIFSIGQRRAFEEILENTRVYKRAQHNSTDASFRSSMVRTHAWSAFSGLSLANISVQSVFALPLFPEDNVNLQWYTQTGLETSQTGHSSFDFGSIDDVIKRDNADYMIGLAISTAGDDRVELSSRTEEFRTKLVPPRALSHLFSASNGTTTGDLIPYKIAVIGDGGAGKSQLTLRLCSDRFIELYDPTIEDIYRKEAVIDGEFCALDIVDTAGTEEYSTLRAQWIREGEGFVIVYRITSRESFAWVEDFYRQIKRIKWYDPDSPIMLAASHCDQITKREVSTQEGFGLAKKLGCRFVECSAKNGINVEKAFYDVVRLLRRQRKGLGLETRLF